MRKLSLILKFLTENHINITSISFDDISNNVLILYEDVLLEINDTDFIYYNPKSVKKFSDYTIDNILEFLNNTL